MGMVKKDLEKGIFEDWGSFIGKEKRHAIAEGTETEVSLMTQHYRPYVQFKTPSIMSAEQVEDMLKALGG